MTEAQQEITQPEVWNDLKEREDQEFLFDWDLLLNAKLKLHPESEFEYDCNFSRVYLEDYDLLNKSIDSIGSITKKLRQCSLEAKHCHKFLAKISQFGYAHAFKVSPKESSGKMENNDDAPTSSGDRVAQNYSDLALFGVEYDVFAPSLKSCRVNYGQQLAKQISGDDALSESQQSSQLEINSSDVSSEDKLNFDFGYDPERDKMLLAKNARIHFNNDKELMKYWRQRFRLYSKFSKGILMDREGWFSVTPERIAEHIADRMVRSNDAVILDAFTGVGGNAIQFALRGAYVYAIDIDPVKIRCAIQNAKIYDALDRITFICGDFFNVVKSFLGSRSHTENTTPGSYGIDGIFLSPPWGGPSYLENSVYDLSHLTPNGFEIFEAARKISPNICYFLPRQTDVKQLIALSGPGGRVEIEQSVLNNKVKSLSAYYGNLVSSS